MKFNIEASLLNIPAGTVHSVVCGGITTFSRIRRADFGGRNVVHEHLAHFLGFAG